MVVSDPNTYLVKDVIRRGGGIPLILLVNIIIIRVLERIFKRLMKRSKKTLPLSEQVQLLG